MLKGCKNYMIDRLREIALDAFKAGVDAADPALALRASLKHHPLPKPAPNGKRYFFGIGKAAVAMMKEALSNRDEFPYTAFVVTNYENATKIDGVEIIAAGHPVPDENGLRATMRIKELATEATSKDEVIVLISGGGSALLPAPKDGLTLDEKMMINDLLLKSNFDITEMNLVRQNLSFLKGGKLAALCTPASVTAYILSDVIGDNLNVVASGPTAQLIGSPNEAKTLLIQREVWTQIPAKAQSLLNEGSNFAPLLPKAENHLIGSNHFAASTMAQKAGAELSRTPLNGEVSAAVDMCLQKIEKQSGKQSFALAWGGETTVNVTGTGKGGRNQEFSLRFAIEAQKRLQSGNWCFLSGATDGRDGPTEAAGGLVDHKSLSRILDAGAIPQEFLVSNDSYHALKLSGDLLEIGATGTNVADLQLFLFEPLI